MPNTPFDVVVFDFDGTLVRSAEAKRQAFFEVFPANCSEVVAAVLARDPDGSRYKVIPEMIAEAGRRGLDAAGLSVETLIEAFAAKVNDVVAGAEAMPGALEALTRCGAQSAVYVASMTPHEELLAQLMRRGWFTHVREAFGYPHRKNNVVAMLLARHGIPAARLLVVGDGVSDRQAAELNGCAFHPVADANSLARIPGIGGFSHV